MSSLFFVRVLLRSTIAEVALSPRIRLTSPTPRPSESASSLSTASLRSYPLLKDANFVLHTAHGQVRGRALIASVAWDTALIYFPCLCCVLISGRPTPARMNRNAKRRPKTSSVGHSTSNLRYFAIMAFFHWDGVHGSMR